MEVYERLKWVYSGGGVQRFHTHRFMNGTQQVDAHSWGVAIIAHQIMGTKDISRNLLLHCLFHDVAEQATGDIPGPVKWSDSAMTTALFRHEQLFMSRVWPDEPHLTTREGVVLKLADALEGQMLCVRERTKGNRGADTPFNLWHRKLAGYSDMAFEELAPEQNDRFQDIRVGIIDDYEAAGGQWLDL